MAKSKKGKASKKKVSKAAKKPAKKKSARKPNAAFMKPMNPSPALAAVIGGSAMPRTEVTKKLWGYIKRNGLQDRVNRRNDQRRRQAAAGIRRQVAGIDVRDDEARQQSPEITGCTMATGLPLGSPLLYEGQGTAQWRARAPEFARVLSRAPHRRTRSLLNAARREIREPSRSPDPRRTLNLSRRRAAGNGPLPASRGARSPAPPVAR